MNTDEIKSMPAFNEMQTVKRRMYAMRNGVVADVLRKGGSPFSIIFGVNVPQLVEIARDMGTNRELALSLWANTSTRESMLIAPMLMPVDTFTQDDALVWVSQIPSIEVADILCHRLLRHLPYALELAERLSQSDNPMDLHVAQRLITFCTKN